MCSAGDFQTADHQHVLPRDADPDDEDPTVPAEEYDGPVDGVSGASTDSTPEVLTDGGEVKDEDENEDENTFDCPECGEHVVGYPDECPECGVPYRWNDEEEN